MSRTRGILLTFARCNDLEKERAWDRWYDEIHIPELLATGAAWAGSRWVLVDRPAQGYPSVGFTHVNMFELEGPDLEGASRKLLAQTLEAWNAGRMNANEFLVDAIPLAAHGAWTEKSAPSAATTGHIFTFTLCNDPRLEADWDAWYDRMHLPDMLSSGAFSSATRWRRLRPVPIGANYLTLYDIQHHDLAEAGRLSGAIMPRLIAQGRKLTCHAGALTVTVRPTGKWGAAGLRAQGEAPSAV